MGGIFETRQKACIQFKLPEFSHNKMITWNVHVDEHTAQYDMIIGMDLMEELQIKIDYNGHHIEWDDVIVAMKNRGTISNTQLTKAIYEFSKESSVLKMSEDRHNEIIKAMYGKIDVNKRIKV